MNYKLIALVPIIGLSLGFWKFHRKVSAPCLAVVSSLDPRPTPVEALVDNTPSLVIAAVQEEIKTETPAPVEHFTFFNPSAMQDDAHLFFNTEALFWQSNVSGLSYGTDSSSTTSIQDGHVKSLHFDYDWGYRLGIGYKLPHDQWDLFANYTYLYGKAHGHSQGILFPTWATNFDDISPFYASHASAHWTMHLNMGDVELGRNCLASRWLALRPFIGLRGGTINQRYTVKYQGGTVADLDTDQLNLDTDFWGVGLRMGLNTLWGLGKGMSIYGNGSTSLLSGHFNVREKEKLLQQELVKMNLEASPTNVVVEADLALGLQWDYMFSKDRYHVGLKLGWEFDIYFDQNQLFNFVSNSSGSLVPRNDDLTFQGLTIGFRFDF